MKKLLKAIDMYKYSSYQWHGIRELTTRVIGYNEHLIL